jgi:hypothetical protein
LDLALRVGLLSVKGRVVDGRFVQKLFSMLALGILVLVDEVIFLAG